MSLCLTRRCLSPAEQPFGCDTGFLPAKPAQSLFILRASRHILDRSISNTEPSPRRSMLDALTYIPLLRSWSVFCSISRPTATATTPTTATPNNTTPPLLPRPPPHAPVHQLKLEKASSTLDHSRSPSNTQSLVSCHGDTMLLADSRSTRYASSLDSVVDPSQTCYFSYQPPSYNTAAFSPSSSHFSVETPSWSPSQPAYSTDAVSDPSHPLLARRYLSDCNKPPVDNSKLLQLQTAAAHAPSSSHSKPRAMATRPSHSTSISSNSSSSSSSPSYASHSAPIRCSRCHRESTFGSFNPTAGMVSYGANLYYCTRCADLVGYRR